MSARPSKLPSAFLDEIEMRVTRGDTRDSLLNSSPDARAVFHGGGQSWLRGLLDERVRRREAERAHLRAPAFESVQMMAEGLRNLAETDAAASDELAAALTFEAKLVQLSTRRSA